MAPRCPFLSTLLFLIEHICGMRGFSLEGAMAADTSKLLTQDQSAQEGYQTICWYKKTYLYESCQLEDHTVGLCREEYFQRIPGRGGFEQKHEKVNEHGRKSLRFLWWDKRSFIESEDI